MKTAVNVEAILFDLDGTLVDTAADFVHILNALRHDHNLPPLDYQIIRDTVSNGARALTKLAFGGNEGETDFEAKKQEMLSRYELCAGDKAQLFDGMSEVLKAFEDARIPWGIITNKPRLYTDILLSKLGLNERSAITLCPDDVQHAKPDPESMILASKRLNCTLSKSIYVGDHERDIQAGKAANMPTVAVSYGYIQDKQNIPSWGADFEIDHPSELISLFL